MKIATTTFTCDVPKCTAQITVHQGPDEPIGAYLDLVEEGWKVQRGLRGWKHVCPDDEIGDLK